MIRFEITGVEAIAAGVRAKEQAYEAGGKAVIERYADFTVNLTRQLAPVDEGFLRDNVKRKLIREDMGFLAGWFSEDFIAAGKPFYALHVEFGTVHMPAQPSLFPAWDSLSPTFLKDLEALGKVFST